LCGVSPPGAGRYPRFMARSEEPQMTSPYLDRPLLPLAVALPRMLTEIETALATARPVETRRLLQRADLIRELLTPRPTEPLST
jgi:hypothetical protein